MSRLDDLRLRAKRRLRSLERQTEDPRFVRVMGRFVRDGLLVVNHDVSEHAEPLRVEEVLWAGRVEPRLLELLPALIVKRPSMFVGVAALPADLAQAVEALKRDREPQEFRGIAGKDIHRWLRRVGQKGKAPSRLKSFRFTPDDQRLLQHLVEALGLSETEIVRRGLRALT